MTHTSIVLPSTSSVAHPRQAGYDLAIDGTLLRANPTQQDPVRTQSARAQAEGVATAELAEELVSATGKTFARADLSGGEGLLLAHRRARLDTDATRYWDSRGLAISRPGPGRLPTVELLEATEAIYAGGNNAAPMVGFDSDLFVGNGTNVTRIDTPNGTPSTAAEAVGAGAVVGLAVLGSVLYAAGTSALRQRVAGVWGATTAVLAGTGIWSVNDRLVVAVGTALREWPDVSSATTNLMYTLPSGHTWIGVVEGPSAVYAAASNGFVYAFTADETTGDLTVVAAQTFFPGETPTAIGASQGLVFVGTTSGDGTGRLWVMQSDSGSLVGQVVREFAEGAPRCIAVDRENAYAVVAEDYGSITHSTWRYDVVTAGVHRWWDWDAVADQTCSALVTLGGGWFAAFANSVDVHRVDTALVTSGWVISPLVEFFTAEEKTWVSAALEPGDIPTGSEILLSYTTDPDALLDADHTSWTTAVTASIPDTAVERSLSGVQSRQLAVKVDLGVGTGGDSPQLESFSVRGLLAPTDVLVQVPVSVTDMVERPYRQPIRVPGLGSTTLEFLRSVSSRNVLLQLFGEDTEEIRGQVEVMDAASARLPWRGPRSTTVLVQVRGRYVTTSGQSLEVGPFGSFMFGSLPFGGAV